MIQSFRHRAFLSLVCLLYGCVFVACGDETEDPPKPEPELPCDGACPESRCIQGVCLPEAQDMDLEDEDIEDEDTEEPPDIPDVPDVEDEPDIPDVEDEPDVPDVADEPDMEDMEPEGCIDDESCPDGQICDDEIDPPLCRAGCRNNDDCEEGLLCDRRTNTCEEICFRDQDCEEGFECNRQERICVPKECEDNDDCAGSQYCDTTQEEPTCTEGCRLDPEDNCPTRSYCEPESRTCLDGCRNNDECDEGTYCLENTCVEGCRGDEECENGQVCLPETLEGGEIRQRCQSVPCTDDSMCADNLFCSIEEGFGAGLCAPGCRLVAGSCPENTRCDEASRLCESFVCEDNEACGPNEICLPQGDVSVCTPGCTDNDSCMSGEECTPDNTCTCLDEGCPEGQSCRNNACVRSCLHNGDCAEGTTCDVGSGLCIVACARDEFCPEGQFCNIDGEPVECLPGCREGSCEDGERCNLNTRTCEEGCDTDEDCAEDAYCDENASLCFTGCRNDESCASDERCLPTETEEGTRQTCVPTINCTGDEDCEEGDYCGVNPETTLVECVSGCRISPNSCPEGERCNPINRACTSECSRDEECGEGFACIERSCARIETCSTDADCEETSWCNTNLDTPMCEPGCRLEPDSCAAPLACDPLLRRCTSPCQNDEACQPHQRCDEALNLCLDQCNETADCPAGTFCQVDAPRPFCAVPGNPCSSDTDCDAGFFCLQDEVQGIFACVEGCRTAPDTCPEEEACNPQTNACETISCEGDVTCPEGLQCNLSLQEPVCADVCVADDHCPESTCIQELGLCACQEGSCAEGETCFQGACLDLCAEDADCPETAACNATTNTCTPRCEENSQCPDALPICQEGSCAPQTCQEDSTCPADQFCDLTLEIAQCVPGCRPDPNNCPEGEACNALNRTCEASCENNAACPPGQACGIDAGHCLDTCISDEQCPQGAACLNVQTSDGEVRVCTTLPDGACSTDDDCADNEFCAVEIRQCIPGCRVSPNNCPRSEDCNPETRLCAQRECENNNECDQGYVCIDLGEDPICIFGCEEDTHCSEGSTCNEVGQCVCENDGQCFDGERCVEGACSPGCTNNNDCTQAEVCEPTLQICVFGCRDDALEPNNDIASASPVQDGFFGQQRMCYEFPPASDAQDCYSIEVQGQGSISASILFAHNEGNLDLFLYGPSMNLVAQENSQDDNEFLSSLLDESGTWTLCVAPQGEPFVSDYSLNVQLGL